MRSMGVIVFVAVAFASLTGIICNPVDRETEIEPNCDLYSPIPKIGLVCNRMFKPVCGTNGQTYSNECELCSDKLKLKREIKIKHKNRCEDDCQRYGPMCTLDFNPVCGSDSVTYGNKCMFCNAKTSNADLLIVSNGECKPKDDCQGYGPVCTREHNPVCGSDSVTYSNKCMFCDAKTRNSDLLIVSNGECKPKDECEGYGEFCTFNYIPVCGSDAVTYSNMCIFCGAKRKNSELSIVFNGDCEKQTY